MIKKIREREQSGEKEKKSFVVFPSSLISFTCKRKKYKTKDNDDETLNKSNFCGIKWDSKC